MQETLFRQLAHCYPQLMLPLSYETKSSPAYRATVLRGEPVSGEPDFIGSEQDSLTRTDTPAGQAQVLYLENREDFEHALRALAYRCEPREILPSVGASTVSGLINWEKIRAHKRAYLAAGGENWSVEFKRFTSDKTNYCDTILLLSSGPYSSIPPEQIGMDSLQWKQCSIAIRKYHELTHFVCRKLWPDKKEPLRDEVFADFIGMMAAFGKYDASLAQLFFGITDTEFRKGGRLEHYVSSQDQLPEAIHTVSDWINRLASRHPGEYHGDVFALLEEEY